MSYQRALADSALRDERVIVMTAENRAAIRELPGQLGDRFIDTGITEQTMVGMAAGLALRGRIPVLHALAAFLTMRPFEFIRTDVGIASLPVKLVGAVSGVLSEANGPTHQALEDIALMRGIPNMGVFCPSDTEELLAGLPAVLASPAPFYIRYIDRPTVVSHLADFVLGNAEILTEGSDVGILTYGAMLREAVEAAALLEAKGLSVQLVNMRTLSPIDIKVVTETVAATRLTVTIEDHFQIGGLHSIVAEILVAHRLAGWVVPIAFDARWFTPALLPDVLAAERLNGPSLAGRIQEILADARHSFEVPQ